MRKPKVIRRGRFRAEHDEFGWTLYFSRPGKRSHQIMSLTLPETYVDLANIAAAMRDAAVTTPEPTNGDR